MIKVEKLNPFGRMCISLGMLPSSYKESLTYEEQLLWFFKFLDETVIPTVNNNAEAVEELQALYVEVKTFVDEYFDNLDVQEEINNKLDEMAENGDLTDIIAQYLGLAGMLTYNTVADMKIAENLTNGSTCQTMGFYSINDGGGAFYKVREVVNTDVINESTLIALHDNTLVAELVRNEKNSILTYGAKKDGLTDISSIWSIMVNDVGYIKIPEGNYLLHNPITISSAYNIDCKGTINYDGSNYGFIVTNASNAIIKIYRFNSENGGMFNISSTNTVSFVNFEIDFSYCKKETFYMNANGGIISLLKLKGVRWSGTTNSPIVMFQDSSTVASSYLSQIDIFNVDLLSGSAGSRNPAIRATCSHATKNINFNLTNVDLENSTGITCVDRIFSIGLFNCRMGEINYVQGWLTFNNYMPLVTLIGNGDIDPHYFTFNNLPDYGTIKSVVTNMNLIDHTTSSTYAGGGIITSRYMKPFIGKTQWLGLGTDSTVTLPQPTISGNIYNYFTSSSTENINVTIPSYLDEFDFAPSQNVDVTFTRGNKTVTVTSTERNGGKIHVKWSAGVNTIDYYIFK